MSSKSSRTTVAAVTPRNACQSTSRCSMTHGLARGFTPERSGEDLLDVVLLPGRDRETPTALRVEGVVDPHVGHLHEGGVSSRVDAEQAGLRVEILDEVHEVGHQVIQERCLGPPILVASV